VTINERLWQSLPIEHNRILESAAREAEIRVREQTAVIERQAHQLAERNRMRLVELKTQDLDQWKFCAAPMLEAYLTRSGQLGESVMAGYRKVLVEAHRAIPSQPSGVPK
jgi:TRAP-type C4-dicarboxylate transport system substrate-binding protein